MLDIKKDLNSAQLEAVNSTEGPVLVIAGAGSGKTRVIEYRVLNLIQKKVNPASILLLTFTRASAQKMLERASRHDILCKNVEGGTFHSFAYRMLKRYSRIIGFADNFSVMDEADAAEAIQRCVIALGLHDKKERFPKKDTLRSIFSVNINKNKPIRDILLNDYPDYLGYIEDIERLRKKYTEYKFQQNLLDYDDLLIFLKVLLQDKKSSSNLSLKYSYIMIDEYQDTNFLQADIAYLLAEKCGNNIMVVGDDAQSIYGFRGATHENIMNFPKRFQGTKVIKLEENYRSTQSVLNLANAVLENMASKYSKTLVSALKTQGIKPQVLFFQNCFEEAEFIADKIKESRDEGILLSEQAVLFRSSYISIPLQAELSRRNIPFQVFGGLKFYETAHVKDFLAYIKVLVNPKDELSWSRILTHIAGIGPKTSDKILLEIAKSSGLEDILKNSFNLFDKRYKFETDLKLLLKVLKNMLDCSNHLQTGSDGMALDESVLSSPKSSIGDPNILVMDSSFRWNDSPIRPSLLAKQLNILLDYYTIILKTRFDDWNLRLNDLTALTQIAASYGSFEELLLDFTIEPAKTEHFNSKAGSFQDELPLTLSTIHSAKGLEWESVFVLGLADGVFPVSFALNDDNEIEEERRLFYVAVTRAKVNLALSMHYQSVRSGSVQFNKVSRFIEESTVSSKLERQVLIEPELDDEDLRIVCPEENMFDRKKDFFNKITGYF